MITAKEKAVLEYWLLDNLLLMGYDEEQADQILYNLRRLEGDHYTNELESWMPSWKLDLQTFYVSYNCS